MMTENDSIIWCLRQRSPANTPAPATVQRTTYSSLLHTSTVGRGMPAYLPTYLPTYSLLGLSPPLYHKS